jgi:ABC-type amino acid transport substrate-binding protein
MTPVRTFCASLALLAVAGTASPADLPELQARKVLRVVVAADESPETFSVKGGDSPGFEREMLEGFARLNGLRLEVVTAKTHADRIPALTRGEGDVIVAIFDTPDRRKQVAFTVEVMPTHNVAVTMAPHPPMQTLAALREAKVAAIRGAKPAEAVAEAGVPARSVVLYERMEDLLQALKAGEVTAAVLPVSELALASKRVPGLSAGTTVGAPGVIAWAVRKEDVALLAALDDYLGNTRRGQAWSRLVVKYFGDETLSVLGRRR